MNKDDTKTIAMLEAQLSKKNLILQSCFVGLCFGLLVGWATGGDWHKELRQGFPAGLAIGLMNPSQMAHLYTVKIEQIKSNRSGWTDYLKWSPTLEAAFI